MDTEEGEVKKSKMGDIEMEMLELAGFKFCTFKRFADAVRAEKQSVEDELQQVRSKLEELEGIANNPELPVHVALSKIRRILAFGPGADTACCQEEQSHGC